MRGENEVSFQRGVKLSGPQGNSKVSITDVRTRNRAAVLQELYKREPKSRADLARATGLTRVTASDVIAELINFNLVEEVGQRSGNRVGKPATLITVNYSAHTILSLELSNQHLFRGALLNLNGEVLIRQEIKLDHATGDAAFAKTVELAHSLMAQSAQPIIGIGVGTPGIVDTYGNVEIVASFGWKDFNLAQELTAQTGLPVYVANDSDTAALAECTFGAGDVAGLLLIQIGQGVGAGILSDGNLLRGPHGTAGEIGHVPIPGVTEQCTCGKIGCLESIVAAPAIRRRLHGLNLEQQRLELVACGEQLAWAISPMLSVLGISDCVIYGPKDLITREFIEGTFSTLNRHTNRYLNHQCTVRTATHGADTVLLGAAAHVINQELGIS